MNSMFFKILEHRVDYRFRRIISCLLNIDALEIIDAKILRIERFRERITIVDEKISTVDINRFSNH